METAAKSDLSACARSFAAAVAIASGAGLILQCALRIADPVTQAATPLAELIRLTAFFTIWTNLLVVLVMSAAVLGRRISESVFAAVTLYIVAVGLIYWLVLSHQWTLTGLPRVADTLLHYAAPTLMALFWLTMAPKRDLQWKDAVLWMAFPAVYGLVAMARGALTGFFPYPFLNAPVIGWPQAGLNMAILAGVYGVMGLALVAFARSLSRRRIMRATTHN